MTREAAFRYWLLAFALCVSTVAICIAYVDRPLALFFDASVRHSELWMWLNRALAPFDLVVGAALICFLACAVWMISGRQLRGWTEVPFLCSASAMWGIAAEISLKRVFGRGWPDPTFVQRHLYGFHFLHGTLYWDSFPSGTATVSAAILSVLWILRRRWRIPGLIVVVLLLAVVVVANYHWLSDVIAGAFLGSSIGWATVRLLHPFGKGRRGTMTR
jgi:membrane-associated phospholipid phosphatase